MRPGTVSSGTTISTPTRRKKRTGRTSLVSIISVADLSYMALKVRSETYRILEVLTAMAVLYWLMGYPQAKIVDWIHRRWKVVE